MGFLKTARKALRHGRRSNRNDSTVRELDKKRTRGRGNQKSSSQDTNLHPPPSQPRAVWQTQERNGSPLTPVPEEPPEGVPKEDETPCATYADLALGDTKRTHIFIDMRKLTDSIDVDEDDDEDECTHVSTTVKKITPFNGRYNSRGYFTQPQTSAIRSYRCSTCSKHRRKHNSSVSRSLYIREALAATEPLNSMCSSIKTSNGSDTTADKIMQVTTETDEAKDNTIPLTGSSAMAILDDIIQSDVKLETPYLTRENVDTSLPGGTIFLQRANNENEVCSVLEDGIAVDRKEKTPEQDTPNKVKSTKSVSFASTPTFMDKYNGDNCDRDISPTLSDKFTGLHMEANTTVKMLNGKDKSNTEVNGRANSPKNGRKSPSFAKSAVASGFSPYSYLDIGPKVLLGMGNSMRYNSGDEMSPTASTYDIEEMTNEHKDKNPEPTKSDAAKDNPTPVSRKAPRVKAKLKFLSSMLTVKNRKSKKKNIAGTDSDDDYSDVDVDVEPLVKYLKLVQDDPDGYQALREMCSVAAAGTFISFEKGAKRKQMAGNPQSWNSLLELGKLYRSSQENVLPQESSLVLQALNELGSKHWTFHPLYSKYEACEKYRLQQEQRELAKLQKLHLLQFGYDIVGKQTRGNHGNVRRLNATVANPGVTLSAIEQARGDVETWIKSLTTAQLVKAKELALEEFGEADYGARRWWISNRHCRYIRGRTSAQDMY